MKTNELIDNSDKVPLTDEQFLAAIQDEAKRAAVITILKHAGLIPA